LLLERPATLNHQSVDNGLLKAARNIGSALFIPLLRPYQLFYARSDVGLQSRETKIKAWLFHHGSGK
jgi:hypothetical protein